MRIRTSKRGLTFSFQKNETFFTGAKYRYIIDRQVSEVIILPDSEGKYQVSRKGAAHKPLIDIRNQEIRDVISNARYIEIEICDDKIIAHIVKSQIGHSGDGRP